ncbi:ComF family protein [Actinokineospora diospyrosa]|uniref:Amidophosphoribosyltransferases n=1 Tax=Actinokineospora diospyrosa TaxID=103728 RepID=A0ABT1II87_9PSEU|nr:phosphoribosyltransferase [Actinokineospora diospyrosa]MCP2272269.1 putative amidophosphoribosyltransferases [Actinokineospora diospyrosa]
MRKLLDLLIPDPCAGCGAPGSPWCPTCAATLRGLRTVERTATRGLPVFALTAYGGPVRRAVIAYKERNRRPLALPLGRALAAALPALAERVPAVAAVCPGPVTHGYPGHPTPGDAQPGGPLWLVPAPSRRRAVRRRGGHHMERVAQVMAATLATAGTTTEAGAPAAAGVPPGTGPLTGVGVVAQVAPVLRLAGAARDSVGLDAAARAANLARHLSVEPSGVPPAGAPVLVLDDVVTTGSTAAACARALRGAGLPVLAVLALAETV